MTRRRLTGRGAWVRRVLALLFVGLGAVTLAGCGIPTDSGPDGLALPPELDPSTSVAPTTTSLPPEAATVTRRVYFLQNDRLVGVPRAFPRESAFTLDLFQALADGPTPEERERGLTSAIPVGTVVDKAPTSGRQIMTIGLNEAFAAGAEGNQRIRATAQFVYTATASPNRPDGVRFQEANEWLQLADGEGVLQELDPETGIPEPLTRSDFLELRPVDEPVDEGV